MKRIRVIAVALLIFGIGVMGLNRKGELLRRFFGAAWNKE